MSTQITKAEIDSGLIKLGVKTGMMLEVHCALSSLGDVSGGAMTVINALQNVVGTDGAIVMPSFKLSPALLLSEKDVKLGLTLKIKLLKEESEKSGMGIVSDTFRKMPDVITGEGIFRVSTWGKDAKKHAEAGFQHLIDNNGYALLIGVDIYSMSSMQYVEDALPTEIKNKFVPSREAREMYPASEWFIESWNPTVKPWYSIQQKASEKGYIRERIIGNAKCMLVQVKRTVELYEEALRNNPYELYGL